MTAAASPTEEKRQKDRYGTLTIALHWLMLALLAAVYACIELRELWPRGSDPRELIKTGTTCLGLSVLGWCWYASARASRAAPPIVPTKPPGWQTGLAHATHACFHLLMIGMPLRRLADPQRRRRSRAVLRADLPPFTGADEALAERIETSRAVGTIGYWLIGLHAVGAVPSSTWCRDNTLHAHAGPERQKSPTDPVSSARP